VKKSSPLYRQPAFMTVEATQAVLSGRGDSTGRGHKATDFEIQQILQGASSTAALSGSTGRVFVFSRKGSSGSTGPLSV
jgi:hypothetical protein